MNFANQTGLLLMVAMGLACSGSDFRGIRGGEGGAGGGVIFAGGSTSSKSSTESASASSGSGQGASGQGGNGGTAGGMPAFVPACDAPAVAPSGGSCFALSLDDKCNPVTLQTATYPCIEECATYDSGMTFQCYTSSLHRALCEECDQDASCNGGLACPAEEGWPGGNHCARYCCSDADCGSGQCIKEGIKASGGALGLCLVPAT
jgi:hypothetical protein